MSTKLRLGQISGSFNALKSETVGFRQRGPGTAAALTGSDAHSLVGALGAALLRIHGAASDEPFNNSFSELKDSGGASRITYVDGASTILKGPNGDAELTVSDTVTTLAGNLAIPDGGTIGGASVADALTVAASGNVQVKGGKDLLVDEILESTGNAGVTIDGVLIKDNDIVIPNDATIGSAGAATAIAIASDGVVTFVDDIKIKDGGTIGVASAADAMTVAASGIVTFKDDILLKDVGTIGNASQADGITLLANGNIQIKAAKDLLVDEILESTSAAGVTIDGVLMKDNDIVIPNDSTIGSAGAAAAMTIDSDGIVAFIDDIKIKDGGTIGVASAVDALTLASNGDLTLKEDLKFADGKLLGSTTTVDLLTVNANDLHVKAAKSLKVDTIVESAGNAGVTVEGVLLKDNDVVIPDGSTIGSVTVPAAMTIDNAGIVTFADDIKIKDGGTIGSATDPDAMTISSGGDVTFSQDVTVQDDLVVVGDFIVQGATTTVSSSNMVVQDSIIGLGVSGSDFDDSGIHNNVGDRGIVFARGTSGAALPGLWWDGSRFNVATSVTSPISQSFGAVALYSTFRGKKMEFDSADAYIGHDGTDLEIVDNADINLKPAADLLVDAGADIILDAAGNNVTLKSGGTTALDFVINGATDVKLDAPGDIKFDAAGNDYIFDPGGTESFRFTANGATAATLDIVGDGIIDVDGGQLTIKDGGEDHFLLDCDNTAFTIFDDQDTGDLFKIQVAQHGATTISTVDDDAAAADLIMNVDGGVIMDAAGDITLDAGGNDWLFAVADTTTLQMTHANAGDMTLGMGVSNKDMVFKVNDGGAATEVYRLVGADSALQIATGKTLRLAGNGTSGVLLSDGTDAQFTSNGNLKIESTVNEAGAVYIHANGGTSEQILVQANQGTGDDSVKLLSDDGGIFLHAGKDDAQSIKLQGFGMEFQGGDQNDSLHFKNSPLKLEKIAEPASPLNSDKMYNVDGQLRWNGQVILSGTTASNKAVLTVTGSGSPCHPANSPYGLTGANFRLKDANNKIDIYVNGQLMASGSALDYVGGTGSSADNLKFSFGLESGDIITYVERAL